MTTENYNKTMVRRICTRRYVETGKLGVLRLANLVSLSASVFIRNQFSLFHSFAFTCNYSLKWSKSANSLSITATNRFAMAFEYSMKSGECCCCKGKLFVAFEHCFLLLVQFCIVPDFPVLTTLVLIKQTLQFFQDFFGELHPILFAVFRPITQRMGRET